jgi:hypothetical protein
VIAEVSTAAKAYFSRASTYLFLPDNTKNSESDWRMAKYKIRVQAYAGIGAGKIYQVDLEEGSFEHLPDAPTDEESGNDTQGGGTDDDDECSCDSNGRHSDGDDLDGEDSDDEADCGNFVFVMGAAMPTKSRRRMRRPRTSASLLCGILLAPWRAERLSGPSTLVDRRSQSIMHHRLSPRLMSSFTRRSAGSSPSGNRKMIICNLLTSRQTTHIPDKISSRRQSRLLMKKLFQAARSGFGISRMK